jgi:hypothetical protein
MSFRQKVAGAAADPAANHWKSRRKIMESTLANPVSTAAVPTRTEAARTAQDAGSTGLPRAQVWTGRVLSGFAVLFLAFDTVMKLLLVPEATKGTVDLGYPSSALFGIGVVELICLVAYLVPRTAVLGAVLFTGYLGGAIATHVRVGNPLFTHVLFPVYVAAFIWGGLYLRDRALRAVLPFRNPS